MDPRGHTVSWAVAVPIVVIAAGLALGLVLWDRWGLAVAFEAIRSYCF